MDYRDAGVNIEAGRAFVNRIESLVKDTYRPGVLGGLGDLVAILRFLKATTSQC